MPERDPVRFGKYDLFERIAVGGMAEVFRARPHGSDQELAVKRIHPHHLENDDFVSMLIDEAKISFQLDHPNIVQVVDMGRVDKHYFIAMEFIGGRDLRRVMERLAESGRAFPIADAIAIIAHVAKGLDYAHSKADGRGQKMEIVHRDISPQNILVGFNGVVKVIDFGIAKAAGRLMETQVGILKGKYAYMSPEQATGGALDHRTDIFSTGIMLYEAVVGRHPFRAPHDLETLRNIKNSTMVPAREANPQVPASVEKVIKQALATRREDRYFTAGAMAAELEKALQKIQPGYTDQDVADFIDGLFSDEIAAGAAIREYIPPSEAKPLQSKARMLGSKSMGGGGADTLAPSSQRRDVSRSMSITGGATAVAERPRGDADWGEIGSGTMAIPARGAPIVIGPSKGEQLKESLSAFFKRVQEGALTPADSAIVMGFSLFVVIVALVLLLWEPQRPVVTPPAKATPKARMTAAPKATPFGGGAATPMGTQVAGATGVANVTSLPPGLEIRVDGRLIGKTPKRVDLPTGTVSIEVRDPQTGVTDSKTVTIEAGKEARASFSL